MVVDTIRDRTLWTRSFRTIMVFKLQVELSVMMAVRSLSQLGAHGAALVLSVVDGIDGPHAVHYVHFPTIAGRVPDVLPGLWGKFFAHYPYHLGVVLQEVFFVVVFQLLVS